MKDNNTIARHLAAAAKDVVTGFGVIGAVVAAGLLVFALVNVIPFAIRLAFADAASTLGISSQQLALALAVGIIVCWLSGRLMRAYWARREARQGDSNDSTAGIEE